MQCKTCFKRFRLAWKLALHVRMQHPKIKVKHPKHAVDIPGGAPLNQAGVMEYSKDQCIEDLNLQVTSLRNRQENLKRIAHDLLGIILEHI